VRIPMRAQMTQRLISTVLKACGERYNQIYGHIAMAKALL
jgi:hypothetical protein